MCPLEGYVEVLKSNTQGCELVWKWGFCRCSQVKLRSLGGTSISDDGCRHRKRKMPREETLWGQCHVMTGAELRAMGCRSRNAITLTRGMEGFYPESLKVSGRPCGYLDFRRLASQAVKESFPIVLGYPLGGTLFWKPQERTQEVAWDREGDGQAAIGLSNCRSQFQLLPSQLHGKVS